MEGFNMEIIVSQAVYEEVVVKGQVRLGSKELGDLARRDKVKVLKSRHTELVKGPPRPTKHGRVGKQ